MKHAKYTLVLVCCAVGVACASLETKQKVEADEDAFCRAVAATRAVEAAYALGKDGGEAGAKP